MSLMRFKGRLTFPKCHETSCRCFKAFFLHLSTSLVTGFHEIIEKIKRLTTFLIYYIRQKRTLFNGPTLYELCQTFDFSKCCFLETGLWSRSSNSFFSFRDEACSANLFFDSSVKRTTIISEYEGQKK